MRSAKASTAATLFSYAALRLWARAAVSVFYADTAVTNRAPDLGGRPAVLAANHGNALGDVAVIVAKAPAFPHFLASATWWKSPPARFLFGLGGALPIHRRRDGETLRNAETFAACHDALAEHRHLVIFPEGEMHLEPTLLPLKTGAARIALGAGSDRGVGGVVLVPVGLVYEDRGRFRSRAAIEFGEPIEIDDWVDDYRADPAKVIHAVTELLGERLAEAVSRRTRDLVAAERRSRVVPLGTRPRRWRRRTTAEVAVMTVPALVGLLANAPVLVGCTTADLLVRHEGWRATVKGLGATLLCPITWFGEWVWLSKRFGRGRATVMALAGATAGLAALGWWDHVAELRRDASGRTIVGAPGIAPGDSLDCRSAAE